MDYDFCHGGPSFFRYLQHGSFAAAAGRPSMEKIFLYGFPMDFNALDHYTFWIYSRAGSPDAPDAGKIYGILGDAESQGSE